MHFFFLLFFVTFLNNIVGINWVRYLYARLQKGICTQQYFEHTELIIEFNINVKCGTESQLNMLRSLLFKWFAVFVSIAVYPNKCKTSCHKRYDMMVWVGALYHHLHHYKKNNNKNINSTSFVCSVLNLTYKMEIVLLNFCVIFSFAYILVQNKTNKKS